MHYTITIFLALTFSFPALGMVETKMQHAEQVVDQELALQEVTNPRDCLPLTPCLRYEASIAKITQANMNIVRIILEYVYSLNPQTTYTNSRSLHDLMKDKAQNKKSLIIVQHPRPLHEQIVQHDEANSFNESYLFNNLKPLSAPADAIHYFEMREGELPIYLCSYADLFKRLKNNTLLRSYFFKPFLRTVTKLEIEQKLKAKARRSKARKAIIPPLNLPRSNSGEHTIADSPNPRDGLTRRHPHTPPVL